MNRVFCSFTAQLKQAVQGQSPSFRVRPSRYVLQVLDILVAEGYVRYYAQQQGLLTVYLRTVAGRLLLSRVEAKSRPSKRQYARYRQVGKRNAIRLFLVEGRIINAGALRATRRGGLFLLEFI